MSAKATPPSTPILRVKRRRSQSPAGALVLHLSAKRRKETDLKTAQNVDSPSSKEAVFKFAATLENPSDTIKGVLDKSERIKNDPKQVKRILEPSSKQRTSKQESLSSEKRYKVISALRGFDPNVSPDEKEESDRLFRLVDIIKDDMPEDTKSNENVENVDQITCNGVPLVKLAEEEYVYDVYTMQNDAFSSTESDRSLVADDFDALDIMDVRYLDCRDLEPEADAAAWRADIGEDSDSNDEDHWKNDYPDENDDELDDDADEERFYRDDDLDLDFEKFHLKHGNVAVASDDSSDDDEELVFTTSADFEQDANLHGASYARFKRKIIAQMKENDAADDGKIEEYIDGEDEIDINEVDEF
jgi:hypothetical protein